MLTTDQDKFLLNGEEFRVLSGSIHYFRVVPAYWKDRLLKLKVLGLNTVETYIPWNLHEPKKGQFDFDGIADFESFVKVAEEVGLYVILRPSPYICAEWEFGGLPAWLLKDKNIELRCSDPTYLKHVDEYYDELIPRIQPLLSSHGGPVIAVQIENEYGGFGDEEAYLTHLEEGLKNRGIDVLLFTSDGPDMIQAGSLPHVLTTLNFGSRVENALKELTGFKKISPKMCMEFWIGWFDYWGGEHHTRNAADVAAVFEEMLEKNMSVNYYMFHGGTNFGFYNGANHYEAYTPTITSYDYDALLSESGEITEKYKQVQNVLRKYTNVSNELPEPIQKKAYGELRLIESISLFDLVDSLTQPVIHPRPLSMEQLDQAYGYTLYRVQITGKGVYEVDTTPIRDRAYLYVNGQFERVVYRNDPDKTISIEFPEDRNTLELFVENMGRVNYGKKMKDSKGLIDNLWINGRFHSGWEMYPLELTDDCSIHFNSNKDERFPKFFHGELEVDEVADTFINLEGWTKGNVYVNNTNIGRYWEVGPQKTLFIPGPLLKRGKNRIVVLELEGHHSNAVTFTDQPELG
ncbi:beta-galactosidase family protein [Alkalihalophilus sp. As8PL]|uniref:Beta-galactosidase family protein n=1 Tax=Alkalihalophilus sp. As8PL TaxID=3237103 RepID=A0AB39BYH5_9BACI